MREFVVLRFGPGGHQKRSPWGGDMWGRSERMIGRNEPETWRKFFRAEGTAGAKASQREPGHGVTGRPAGLRLSGWVGVVVGTRSSVWRVGQFWAKCSSPPGMGHAGGGGKVVPGTQDPHNYYWETRRQTGMSWSPCMAPSGN